MLRAGPQHNVEPAQCGATHPSKSQLKCPYSSLPGTRAAHGGAHVQHVHLILAAEVGGKDPSACPPLMDTHTDTSPQQTCTYSHAGASEALTPPALVKPGSSSSLKMPKVRESLQGQHKSGWWGGGCGLTQGVISGARSERMQTGTNATNKPWSNPHGHMQAARCTIYYFRCSHDVCENALQAHAELMRSSGMLFCPSSFAHCASRPVFSNPHAKNKGTLQ